LVSNTLVLDGMLDAMLIGSTHEDMTINGILR